MTSLIISKSPAAKRSEGTLSRPARSVDSSRAKTHVKKNRSAGDWAILLILIIGGLVMLFPLLVVLLNAFKSAADYSTNGSLSWPREFSLAGIKTFWNATAFPWRVWTSVWTSALVALLAVGLSMFNAFALGIGRVKGRTWIVLLIMLANMMPQESLLYPLYIMFKSVGLYDSDWGIVVIFTVLQSAFGTYLLSSVYSTFPKAILEAAVLDGASRWQIFRKLVYPISRPTLAVLLVFFFIWTWNEYMIPNAFLISNSNQTVPIALSTLSGQNMMDATTTAGASLISIIPTLVFFLIFQRTLARGITTGAVK